MDFANDKCIICSSKGLKFLNNLRDDDTHFAVECCSCGHVQTAPIPTVEEDEKYYQDNEMSRRLVPKSILEDKQMMLKYETYADVQCKIITNKFPDKNTKILEIGSGYGWFVDKMRKAGYDTDGIELSREKREMAENFLNVNLFSHNLLEETIPNEMIEAYDVVCMFYVLEHILNPQLFIERTLRALKPNGKLLVIVPNFFDHLKQHSDNYNQFSYFRAHLSYFKSDTLQNLFELCGLKDVICEGTQLYSLENAIHWLRSGKPYLESCQIEMPQGLEWVDDFYKKELERQLTSDGIMAIGSKR